ncbi:MAG TPA: hypothetical protein VMB02_05200 [Candidatus Aquilonibacter sp.]|nr:hypothetical protein [Candidatus Aquilonibacter sp.]
MKLNRHNHSAIWKPFVGALLALCFVATSAHADTRFRGAFTLSHEVRWANTILEPGQYSLTFDGNARLIVIRDASNKIVARERASGDYVGADQASELIIAVQGNQRSVSSAQFAGLGNVYLTAHPFPAHERVVEVRNTEAAPIQPAGN